MTADYLQKSAGSLNTIFQLYKAKIKDLPKRAETDTAREDVANWFGNSLNEFEYLANNVSDKDVANFSSHFALACLTDLQDKYENKPNHTECRWLSKNFTIEEFSEYLNGEVRKGDIFRVNGVTIEIKRIND